MTDLTDRMRTCATYLLTTQLMRDYDAVKDATDLLIEASNALEAVPPPLGEPMAILEPVAPKPVATPPVPRAVWTAGDLPAPPLGKPSYRPPRVCPECDSRANKLVFRDSTKLMLACPVCSFAWEYKP